MDSGLYLCSYFSNSGKFSIYYFLHTVSSFFRYYHYDYYNNPLRVVHFHIINGVSPTGYLLRKIKITQYIFNHPQLFSNHYNFRLCRF